MNFSTSNTGEKISTVICRIRSVKKDKTENKILALAKKEFNFDFSLVFTM